MSDKSERLLHVEIESIGMYSILKADGDPKTVGEFLDKLNADEYIGPFTSVSSAFISAVKAAHPARADAESHDGQ